MTDQPHGATATVLLPPELAPSLTGRVVDLLAEVTVTVAPEVAAEVHPCPPRCVVCCRGGKLGGHHHPDGTVQWIHRGCHRRLHRSGRHVFAVQTRRRSRYAC